MNVCPTAGPVAPPAELIPFMLVSLLVPIVFIAAFVGLVIFLVWKLVQANERHRSVLEELAGSRVRIAALESELSRLRGPSS